MTPELSVVVATHNRRESVHRCLDALRMQTLDPSRFEVIVADDGSTDGTAGLLEGLSTPFALRVLRLRKAGQCAAQNAGIEAAQGRVCLFLDDDVIASPELLAEHLTAHRGGERIFGTGALTQQPPEARDWYAHAFARSQNRDFEALARKEPSWSDCWGANFSAPRAALVDVGGFAANLRKHPDMELAFRLHLNGYAARYLPRARAVHVDPKRTAQLLADMKRSAAAQVELAERYPAMLPILLGRFGATTPRELVLRRLLIALRVPPRALAAIGVLFRREAHRWGWYHFVTRVTFWSAVRRQVSRERWMRITYGVPVLMYHAFAEVDEQDRFVVSRRAFARQLRLLRLFRYRSIALTELVEALRDCRPPPPRAVVITIDDGYRDNLEIAQPLLCRYGFSATIFPVSKRLGGVNDWSEGDRLGRRPMLSSSQVLELSRHGVDFGAHTRTHPSLPDVPDAQVTEEIAGSRADLEQILGRPVTTFAYPYGRFDDRAVVAVREAGFDGVCTVKPRLVRLEDDPLMLPRVEIRSTDSLLRFLLKVWFGGA